MVKMKEYFGIKYILSLDDALFRAQRLRLLKRFYRQTIINGEIKKKIINTGYTK